MDRRFYEEFFSQILTATPAELLETPALDAVDEDDTDSDIVVIDSTPVNNSQASSDSSDGIVWLDGEGNIDVSTHLLNQNYAQVYLALPLPARALYARLFTRSTFHWLRTSSFIKSVEVDADDEDGIEDFNQDEASVWTKYSELAGYSLDDALKPLIESGLLETLSNDNSPGSLQTILSMLHKDELKMVLSQAGYKHSSALSKQSTITAVCQWARTQRTLTSTSLSCRVLTLAHTQLGTLVRRNMDAFMFFQTIHVAYFQMKYWGEVEWNKDVVLMLGVRGCVYPEYTVAPHSSETAVFPTSTDLHKYADALRLERQVQDMGAVECKQWQDIVDSWKTIVEPLWTRDVNQIISEDSSRPALMQSFTVPYVYTRLTFLASAAYGKLKQYSHERDVLQLLLKQQKYCSHKRGVWWSRLILVMHKYLTPKKSAQDTLRDKAHKRKLASMRGLLLDSPEKKSPVRKRIKKAQTDNLTEVPMDEEGERQRHLKMCLDTVRQALMDPLVVGSARRGIIEKRITAPRSIISDLSLSLDDDIVKNMLALNDPQNNEDDMAFIVDGCLDEGDDDVCYKTEIQVSEVTIYGTKVAGNVTGRKSRWVTKTVDGTSSSRPSQDARSPRKFDVARRVRDGDESGSASVEQLCLDYYRAQGWVGGHYEGSILRMIFALLYWDILFCTSDIEDPDGNEGLEFGYVFQNMFQDRPLDLRSSSFYDNRRTRITRRTTEISMSLEFTLHQLAQVYARESSKKTICVGVDWSISFRSLNDLTNALGCLRVSKLCTLYCRNWQQFHSGFPDLTLWKVDGGTESVKMVEVKGPGDTLMDHQTVWLNALVALGIPIEVCLVKNIQ